MESLNSRYVFTDKDNLKLIGGKYVVDLGLNPNRPPYEIVSLIEGCIILNDEVNGIVLKSDLQASNYYSIDNEGSVLGIFHFSTSHGTDHRYELSDSSKARLQVSNARYVTLSPRDMDGVDSIIDFADIQSLVLLFKIDFPAVGEIQKDYVKSIQKSI